MKRVKQMMEAATRKLVRRSDRAVPLMVPHGGGESGRDFESAFELLQGDERTRDLWHRARVKIPFGRAS